MVAYSLTLLITLLDLPEFHMPALQFLRAIAEVDQKYYPETMNKLYLINSPGAFVTVWKIVKGWLDPGVCLVSI